MVVRVKGLSKVVANIEKKLKGARIGKSAQKVMTLTILEDTKQTIRDGRNPNTKNSAAIKKLKSSTIKRRGQLAVKNSTHSDYSQNKSNLTLTGELINSLRVNFKRLSRGVGFKLFAVGNHKRYTGSNGKRIGKRVSNADIIAGQKAMGRDVLGIRGKTKKKIINILKELYIDVLQ